MRVLMPLPDRDFDVTEVAVPWRVLRDAGHQIVFATEQAGTVPAADPRLLTGVLFGQLGAAPQAKGFYEELSNAEEFTATAGGPSWTRPPSTACSCPAGTRPGCGNTWARRCCASLSRGAVQPAQPPMWSSPSRSVTAARPSGSTRVSMR